MPTLTKAAPKVKSSRKAPVLSLCMALDHVAYGLTPVLGIQDTDVIRAWELEKKSDRGCVYHVHQSRDGVIHCDCPDGCYRREGLNPEPCKHGRSLIQLGLLDAPAVNSLKLGSARPEAVEVIPPAPVALGEPIPAKTSPREPVSPLTRQQADAIVREAASAGVFDGPDEAYNSWMATVGKAALARRPFAEGLYDDVASVDTAEPCCSPAEVEPCMGCGGKAEEIKASSGALIDDGSIATPVAIDPQPFSLAPHDPNRLTLAEFIRHQAGRFKLMETAACDLIAGVIDDLAAMVEFHRCDTPEDFNRAIGLERMESIGAAC